MERIDGRKHLKRALWGKKDTQIYNRLLMIALRKVFIFSRFANQFWLQNFNMEDVFYNDSLLNVKTDLP